MSAGSVSWFVLEHDLRPALEQAKLSPARLAKLLGEFEVERVEELAASRAREFIAAVAEAADCHVWVPPAGATA